MKKISISIICFNEEKNVELMYKCVKSIMDKKNDYCYEIIFADNASTDKTPEILRELSALDKNVKVILNMKNVGPTRSSKNALFHASGDAVISVACDFQEPPEMILEFIKEWEKGNLIIWGQKVKSKENKIKFFLRKLYYKIIKFLSENPQYEQVTGFGLMDRRIIEQMKALDERTMTFRHVVGELGYPVVLVPYTQNKRRAGKSSYNLYRYFNHAITTMVYTSKLPLRLATIMGTIASAISFFIGIIYLVLKLLNWDNFVAGMAPMVIGFFFVGSIQLLFIGIIGEYIGVILEKVTKRPLVVEKETFNFNED